MTGGGAVRLGTDGNEVDGPDRVAARVRELADDRPLDVAAVLAWAREVAPTVPLPGAGGTAARFTWLATVAAADLTVARIVEPHLDAVAILDEAGVALDGELEGATWGVWAAEGPGQGLRATAPATGSTDGGALLSGVKPWCSLAGQASHALVTAWGDDGRRTLFSVALDQPGVTVDAGRWAPQGLAEVATATVTMQDVRGTPVGGPGWYVTRPGFAWGGVGVAAIWFGGAVGLARRLTAAAGTREPDQVAQMHLGAVDAALAAAASVLETTAARADAGPREGDVPPGHLAARARQVVADASEEVLTRVGHGLGPGPLAHEPEHGRRVADLGLYLRQHHAERDQAALGRLALEGPGW